jgi:hypothetical protein
VRRAELSRHDREDAKKARAVSAVRAFLGGIVDYAGLFPPASLDMPAAVGNYARYRSEDAAWMLGRFVVPVARLHEFSSALAAEGSAEGPTWQVSALLGADVAEDLARVRAFNDESARARIDSLEARAATVDSIDALGAARFDGEVFAELPVNDRLEMLVGACARAHVSAKLRTGGVTPDVFVSSAEILRFMRACVAAGVRFKATAGLHHPLAGEYPLTYASDAPRATMHGYLSLFLAAAMVRAGNGDEEILNLLDERDPAAFRASSAGIAWRERFFDAADLRASRDVAAASFGSCSFREPVDELRALALAG